MLKFLADVNVEKRIVDALRESGYDVLWVPDYDCGMNDRALLKLATAEQRVLIPMIRILENCSFGIGSFQQA